MPRHLQEFNLGPEFGAAVARAAVWFTQNGEFERSDVLNFDLCHTDGIERELRPVLETIEDELNVRLGNFLVGKTREGAGAWMNMEHDLFMVALRIPRHSSPGYIYQGGLEPVSVITTAKVFYVSAGKRLYISGGVECVCILTASA